LVFLRLTGAVRDDGDGGALQSHKVSHVFKAYTCERGNSGDAYRKFLKEQPEIGFVSFELPSNYQSRSTSYQLCS